MYPTIKKLTKPFNQKSQKGFSLVELSIVLLILAIIAVLALPQIMSSRRLFRFSGVQRQVVTSLREARQEAMSQRRPITIKYDDVNKKLVIWGGSFGAAGDSRNREATIIGDGLQPDDVVYGRPAGASIAALGDGTNMTSLVASQIEVTFQSDGAVINANNVHQNTALFFYSPEAASETAFAVSILGAGGRTKLWRYNQNANIYVE